MSNESYAYNDVAPAQVPKLSSRVLPTALGLIFIMAGVLCILFPPTAGAIGLVCWDLLFSSIFLGMGVTILGEHYQHPVVGLIRLLLPLAACILCLLFPPPIIAAGGAALTLWHVFGTGSFFLNFLLSFLIRVYFWCENSFSNKTLASSDYTSSSLINGAQYEKSSAMQDFASPPIPPSQLQNNDNIVPRSFHLPTDKDTSPVLLSVVA